MNANNKEKNEVEEMKTRLDIQDRHLEKILFCLTGSESLGIEGALPALKRIEKEQREDSKKLREECANEFKAIRGELNAVIDWKKMRGKVDYIMVGKVIGGAIGISATIFGMFAAYRSIFP